MAEEGPNPKSEGGRLCLFVNFPPGSGRRPRGGVSAGRERRRIMRSFTAQ